MDKQEKGSPTRRGFFETVGRYGAGAAVASLGVETSRGFMANDTLSVACIGTGGRCRHLMTALVKVPGVKIVGVADIYDKHRAEGKKLADPMAVETGHYRELLDRKDVDAVLIAAPDHWHVPMTVDACQAGKDVYVEKPLTHDLEEGRSVIAARDKSSRIVQVGTQQRSMPHIQEAYELVKKGRLGRIFKVHMSWNRGGSQRMQRGPQGVDPKGVDWKSFLGNAPDQPFDEYAFRNWRWFWDFGGGLLTDLMVHWSDVAHWFLDLDHPEKALTMGDHFAARGVWQTPDTIQTLLSYPGDLQLSFEGTFSNARRGAMIEFMGTDGSLYIDRGAYILDPEPGQGRGGRVEKVVGTDKHRGRDFYDIPDGELLHLTNWVDCIRTRKTPNAPVEAGVSSVTPAHLGNKSYRKGQVAVWETSS